MRLFFCAMAGALLVSAIPLAFAYSPFPVKAWLAGYALALVNAVAGVIINTRAIGPDHLQFLRRAGCGHMLRLGLLAGIICGIMFRELLPFSPFFTALIAAYFVFLSSEIAMLHRRM